MTDASSRPPDISLVWLNEPREWSWDDDGALDLTADPGTDFWQRTHYGFQADSGHLFATPVDGDFTMSAHVLSAPHGQYDQAGLMVRLSPACWLKTSIEFEPQGPSRLGVVVTNDGWSDWSTQDVEPPPSGVSLRIRRTDGDYAVHAWLGGPEQQLRIAHLHAAGTPMCGLYACCPRGDGFDARFTRWSITA